MGLIVVAAEEIAEPVRVEAARAGVPLRVFGIRDHEVPEGAESATAVFRYRWSPSHFREVLQRLPAVQWVHTASGGVDGVVNEELVDRGIILTNSRTVHAGPIAEYVMAAVLMTAKRFPTYAALQRCRRWERLHAAEVAGQLMGILGLGATGLEIARQASVLGMRVWGIRRRARPTEGVERVLAPESLPELCAVVDYLVIALPLTAETRGMLGYELLVRMRPTAVLVNVARGAVVNQEDLVRALQAGRPGWAVLDVFEEEPLAMDSPLYALSNVSITPHVAAFSPAMEPRLTVLFVENCRRFAARLPMLHVVNLNYGY